MDFLFATIFIGLALAMDCLAVAFATGAHQRDNRIKAMLVLAVTFGFFQFGMTILGWLIGSEFASVISAYDHFVAAALLFIIGGKMVIEGVRDGREEPVNVFSLSTIIILAIATSIDALAIGISYAFLQISPVFPALVIGLIAAAISVIGVAAGGRAGSVLGHRVDIIGGFILFIIGLRILIEHMI
jgi:putative Mn2+ efflux pump MntP